MTVAIAVSRPVRWLAGVLATCATSLTMGGTLALADYYAEVAVAATVAYGSAALLA